MQFVLGLKQSPLPTISAVFIFAVFSLGQQINVNTGPTPIFTRGKVLMITTQDGNFTIRNGRTGALLATNRVIPAAGFTPEAATNYTFHTLSVPAGSTSAYAGDIRTRQVVGGYSDTDGFILNSNGFQTLDYPGAPITNLSGINSSGSVVGDYGSNYQTANGLIYRNGTFTSVSGASTFTVLSGINDSGAIVGQDIPKGGIEPRGLLIDHGVVTIIRFPGATFTTGDGINESGEIVGTYYKDNFGAFGYSYTNGQFTTIQVPGATNTYVDGINNDGVIVGSYFDSNNDVHGFVLDNGQFTTVDYPGALQTQVTGVDDAGVLVGQYYGSDCTLSSMYCAFAALPVDKTF